MIHLRASAALALAAAMAVIAPAAFADKPPRPTWPRPSAPLPSLPVVAVVRLDVARDHIVVTEDVRFTRGDAPLGDLRLHVAFGAPGAPRAFDAHLFAVDADAAEPPAGTPGAAVAVERVSARPAGALALLGPAHMSGAVVAVRSAAFQRATSAGGAAILRLRTLLDVPTADAAGAREIVVRLGSEGGHPLALGRIEVHAAPSYQSPAPALARVEARLCGPDADAYPLAVTLSPRPASPSSWPRPASPTLVSRRATDDLCVRVFEPRPQN